MGLISVLLVHLTIRMRSAWALHHVIHVDGLVVKVEPVSGAFLVIIAGVFIQPLGIVFIVFLVLQINSLLVSQGHFLGKGILQRVLYTTIVDICDAASQLVEDSSLLHG